jgi:hypothetical protein
MRALSDRILPRAHNDERESKHLADQDSLCEETVYFAKMESNVLESSILTQPRGGLMGSIHFSGLFRRSTSVFAKDFGLDSWPTRYACSSRFGPFWQNVSRSKSYLRFNVILEVEFLFPQGSRCCIRVPARYFGTLRFQICLKYLDGGCSKI